MEIDNENVKIKIYFPKTESKYVATAVVSVRTVEFGFLTIKMFRIWKSPYLNSRLQEKINITPPALVMYGATKQLIFIENADEWFRLEALIYDAYHLAVTKQHKRQPVNEDVNPDDVPL